MVEFYTHLNAHNKTLVEMAEVGRFDTFKITVFGNEGPIPHFHFESLDGTIDGCIRLDKPEYFKHGTHQSTLKHKERRKMIEWLQTPHKSLGEYGLINWKVICIYWDDNNINYPFNKNATMPDYSQLN